MSKHTEAANYLETVTSSAKLASAGPAGQIVGMEMYIIRLNGFALQQINDAAELLRASEQMEQQRDKLLAALEGLLSGTMSMPNRGRATEGKWTTINALTDTVEKARSVVAEAKGE